MKVYAVQWVFNENIAFLFVFDFIGGVQYGNMLSFRPCIGDKKWGLRGGREKGGNLCFKRFLVEGPTKDTAIRIGQRKCLLGLRRCMPLLAGGR